MEKKFIDKQILHETVAPQTYRDAMSHFAGAVNIVTTDGAAGLRGTTVSACCSLSDAPPTVLVCLMRHHDGNRLFLENGVFCINTLAGHHQDLSDIFAGRHKLEQKQRFEHGQWGTLNTGAPVLEDALAAFDCRVVSFQEHATHYIIVGEVVGIASTIAQDALLYLNRNYRRLDLE